jgi:hypothetical protein
MKLKLITTITIAFAILTQSCEKEGENETKISYFDENESHKEGENCMECHKVGGIGEGWFTLAGTVYDNQQSNTLKNATIKLYTEADGAGILKYSLQGDALGNFYTTEAIDFGSGLYTSVEGNTTVNHMTSMVIGGQCNSCHGTSTAKIWTE